MEKIRTHGRTFTGVVISDKMQKTVIVQWQIRKYLKKFERYIQQRVQVAAHNDIKAKEGDMVRIMETKPLSKTKHFTIIENLGTMKGYGQLKESLEEGKHQEKEEKAEQKTGKKKEE
ncbi:30S ribosomal protein S17 [Candidatus Woesearchaeota archaeon]|nr:30S ribosomal protein S17, small subunit ribosomal protein S17 [uncultured archaeon]KHO47196.1 MAG: 30S ribosomal protein S17, small subunit ribosomal protein S17 [archaeon GW2011_AR4]MBS3129183.1 30S ribosomal protein S17 [Candidatus Woesearchaeota archaeon]HIH37916.1 30S ribosomal protein S17 [Candidatus Woesearchaeota archaeon]HIH48875.1 30S ribosomal protein S17 [Candidatus Woesearchaeota archaeon]